MNKEKYLLVGQSALVTIINRLCQIDDVKGYQNMDILVGCVRALQTIVNGSPEMELEDQSEENISPEMKAAIEAAKVEEDSRK